ncbi:MAG: response regulator [Myxococcales bacterium]|nr:response regulator [Myxococcales bacterium]
MTPSVLDALTLGLIGGGVALLILAAGHTRALAVGTARIPRARAWQLLWRFMIAFSVGYLAIGALVVASAHELLVMATGLILAGGGLFVFLVARMSRATLSTLADVTIDRDHVSEILDALSDGLLLLAPDGRVVSANRRIGEMVGVASDHLVGQEAEDLLGVAGLDQGAMRRVREGTLRRRGRSPLPVELRVVEVAAAHGGERSRLVVVRDRSEIVRSEVQLERAVKGAELALRARHDQSAMLLAECKPKLEALRGGLAALVRDAPSASLEDKDTVTRCLDGLDAALAGIAEAERPRSESGRVFEIAATLRGVASDLELANPGATITTSISVAVPERCEGRETVLRDVLVNVGHYVIAAGGHDLAISVEPVPGDAARCLFEVRAVGEGSLPSERSVAGVNIGLAAARLLCNTIGGKLWEGPGDAGMLPSVSFTAILTPARADSGTDTPGDASPLMMAAAMAMTSSQSSVIAPLAWQGSALVVDDAPIAREVLQKLVRGLGYRVDAVATGAECIERAAERSYDLIFLDLVLPDMSGIEVLTTLRGHERSSRTPIIVISAIEETRSVAACLERGADDYITKPVNPVILRARHHVIRENRILAQQASRQVSRLEEEIKRADGLLRAILPTPVARELQTTGKVVPRRHPDVVVLFADIVGFTAYCEGRPPEKVLVPLQSLVMDFERLCQRHGVLKIKTVGDALIACGGLLDPPEGAAERMVELAFSLRDALDQHPEGWKLRIGIHRGPVVAGIIGDQRFSFDIWGDTVNTAQRIESNGVVGAISVSAPVADVLPPRYVVKSVGVREVKGKGSIEILEVTGRDDDAAAPTKMIA